MQISKSYKILGGPVKKEYKAPFIASALVFKNVVGFCFADFCKKIYAGYKHDEDVKFTPEFIFAKMITLKGMISQGNNARKIALDLLCLMNYPYRPWYINVDQREHILDFEDLGIDLCSIAYMNLNTTVAVILEHPYLAVAFGMFSDFETNDFDAIKFSESLCAVIINHAIYKHCRDNDLFDHDIVLLALYELIHEDVLYSGGSYIFNKLTTTIFRAVQEKSQTLLMFAYDSAINYDEKKEHAKAFLNAPNYSKIYSYSASLYKNTIRDAINRSDWTLFDQFFPLLAEDLGSDNHEVQDFFESAAAKRTKKQNSSSQASQSAQKNTKSKWEHNFSPYLSTAVDLSDVRTKDLFGLITLLEAIGDQKGMLLIKERLKYIFPSERTAFAMLYELISNHVIKIDEKHFDSIPEDKVNLWESYLNAPFEVNIIGCFGSGAIISSLFRDELLRRIDIHEVCLNAWNALAHSYFYSSYEYYTGSVADVWIRKYELTDEFKQKISETKLSCKKFSYIAFSAVKNAVSFHHMGKSNGNIHTRNMMTFNLKKYLDIAETSPQDYSKPRMDSAPIFKVEELISEITGITAEDIYNLTPNLNLLNA